MRRRRAAVGVAALALMASACSAPVAEVKELPEYVVDVPLPPREDLVLDVDDVLGDAPEEAWRSARVVDALHGELALAHARHLSAELPVRAPFTVAERDAADWIVTELHAIGFREDDVSLQVFGVKSLDGHALAQLTALRESGSQERVELSQNVVARLEGTGDGVVVVGAHYDSIGAGVPGDNGTGVGLLLETAWRLQGQELPHSVEFVFFGAEHAGFAGAQVHAGSMSPEQRDDVVLMVNASSLVEADELGFDVGLLDVESGTPARDELSTAIADTATGLDVGLRSFEQGIFAGGANLPFTYAGLRVLNLAAVTGRILERPSLAGGHFSPGKVVEEAQRTQAPGDTEVRIMRPDEDAEGELVTIELVPGRTERALYVYGTFLETLLLGFPG